MRKEKTIKRKNHLIWMFLIPILVFLCLGSASVKANVMQYEGEEEQRGAHHKLAAELPNVQARVHRVGLLHLCVSNWGFFGNGQGHPLYDLRESKGGCFNPNPDEEVLAPSAEYPAGSKIEYLFWGGLWIGALVDEQPYVSVGCDGWRWIHEFWPDGGSDPSIGAIWERSTRINTSCYTPEAVSEQDIIAVYTDTSADIPLSPEQRDPFDNRKHFPLGLQITQQSYSWSYEYAEDFVLIDLFVKNIGVKKIRNMYMGLYIDADVGHKDEDPYGEYGAQDDICGFRHLVTSPKGDCSDTVNLAWIADNDGHGLKGETTIFTPVSPIGVTGARVVRSPRRGLDYSFNWWVSHSAGFPRDWSPWKRENQERWAQENCYEPGKNNFPDDVLGTPGGDCSKYFLMSNGEFDYDQIFACTWTENHPDERWLDKSPECADLANGYDTRYLLSFGPFELIAPGESLVITIGYIAGADLHVDPRNLAKDPKMSNPEGFYANLDFSDFETNAIWAAKVYDNPADDNPCGDGIPDFKGPPPPPSPILSFETSKGRVKVKWNGKLTERSRDSFNSRIDFEGYRVYMSRTGAVEDYALLGSYDKADYKIYKLNRNKERRPWEWKAASVSLDSLKSWLNGKEYERRVIEDDPTIFTKDDPFVIKDIMEPFYLRLSDRVEEGYAVAYDSIKLEGSKSEGHDSLYFETQDWNVGFEDILSYPAYRESVDSSDPPPSDTLDRYWDYEYEVEVFPSQPIWFAVTAFDVGDPQTGLKPLEASRLVNATLVYPVDKWEQVEGEDLKVMVYPNPYRIDGEYSANKYEEGGVYGKRIRFVNLPPRCTIRIYTLDGDLVRTIDHEKDPNALDATYDEWDLISRNTQAVVSGIYLFSVEDWESGENQVGKFVIIK